MVNSHRVTESSESQLIFARLCRILLPLRGLQAVLYSIPPIIEYPLYYCNIFNTEVIYGLRSLPKIIKFQVFILFDLSPYVTFRLKLLSTMSKIGHAEWGIIQARFRHGAVVTNSAQEAWVSTLT